MRILFITFYYSPDLSAGSFRAPALVGALAAQLPDGAAIDVVTTQPNRYRSFVQPAPAFESTGRIHIHRFKLPSHSSGMLDQSKAFVSFAYQVMKFVGKQKRYDLVVATSGRLLTASLASWISRRLNAPLYLDIRDIFVETICDVLPRTHGAILRPFLSLLERWTIGRAQAVNLVSFGFGSYFRSRYPDKEFAFFTNGIDDEFLTLPVISSQPAPRTGDPLRVLYAGNLGESQGLHAILPSLAGLMRSRATFTIIGDGGRKSKLELALVEAGADNVTLEPPLNRQNLIKRYQSADVLFLHLNDRKVFHTVIPSKLFEYAATGKPIWAGVTGSAASFIRDGISNVAVFDPCDAEAAVRAFAKLDLHDKPRSQFIQKYNRSAIMREMAETILALIRINAGVAPRAS